MTSTIKISTKIKLFGTLIVLLVTAIIFITIFLNSQTSKDALLVNIVGKQRMLSQKIAKNIFYIHYAGHKDFYELNTAIEEFVDALYLLEFGDKQRSISGVANIKISSQLKEVKRLWEDYYKEIHNFKVLCMNNKDTKIENNIKKIILRIYKKNPILLENIDRLVTLYTEHSEDKINNIKIAQYIFLSIFLFALIYIIFQLRVIESHVDNFIDYYKRAIEGGDISKLEPMNYEAGNEKEIIEINKTINSFIKKMNSE